MASCEVCGKHTSFGKNVTKVRTGYYKRSNRTFKPNLQQMTLVIDGREQRATVCAKCKRTATRANRIRQ